MGRRCDENGMLLDEEEDAMEFVPDIKRVITDLCDRALAAIEVREYMREVDNKLAYSEWTQKWMVLSDVLSLLTGLGIDRCLSRTDIEKIRKDYADEK